MLKPPIFFPLLIGPRRLSRKEVREGGKMRKGAGSTSGPFGSRDDCFLFHPAPDGFIFPLALRSCRCRPCFLPSEQSATKFVAKENERGR